MSARRSLAPALLAAALLAAACSGGGSDGEKEKPSAGGIPLPAKPPLSKRVITKPVLEASWLLESVGTAEAVDESATGDSVAGIIVTDKMVVTYSSDIVSAVDISTGKTAWRSSLDMQGGEVCAASRPASRDISVITVVFGKDRICTEVATISLKDGAVVDYLNADDESESGYGYNPIDDIATVGDTDYYMDGDGVVRTTTPQGEIQEVGVFPGKADSGRPLAPVPGEDMVVTITDRYSVAESVVGLSVPDLQQVWSVPVSTIFPRTPDSEPEGESERMPALLATDGLFTTLQEGSVLTMVQLDARTGLPRGKVVRDRAVSDPTGKSDELEIDISLVGTKGFTRVEDDLVMGNTAYRLARVSVATSAIVWQFDGSELALRDGVGEVYLEPGPVVRKGRSMLATASNGHSMDLLLLSTATGKLQGRWVVPEKFAWGLADKPFVAAVDQGVVLARDPQWWHRGSQFDRIADEPGPLYDAGSFSWPAVK